MHLPLRSQLTKKQRRQLPSLARKLLRRIEEVFPAEPFRAAIEPLSNLGQIEDLLVVRLSSPHSQVPELWFALFQPDEITAYWGSPWHWHIVGDFSWKKKGMSVEKAERQTLDKTIHFIQDVLRDQAVLCIVRGSTSVVYMLPHNEDALIRAGREQSEFYTWTGPWDKGNNSLEAP